MTYNLLLNSSNVIGSSKSTYSYKFLSGAFDIHEGAKMCVSQIVVPYSWFNISSSVYNNSRLSYKLNNITYNIIIPDGFYIISDINNYIQQFMIQNNQYCINNATNNYVFFINLYSNPTYYANQFVLSPVIPNNTSGYTFPSGYINSSGANYGAPQIIFPSTGGLNTILGFTAGTYPSSTSTSSNLNILSNTTPNATNVNSVIVRCNLVKNSCAYPSDVIDAFSINASFGSNLSYEPSYEKWIDVSPGKYDKLIVTFVDQNLNTIYFNDSNVTISLLLTQGQKPPDIQIPRKILNIKQLQFNNDDVKNIDE